MHSTSPIRSASDGSVLDCLGYQGWPVATIENEILIQGFGEMDVCVEDTHSYRAELYGNIATFTILNIIRRVYGFVPCSIKHGCDNQSAITSTWKHNTISVFDRTKPDAYTIIVARVALSDLQLHSLVNPTGLQVILINEDHHTQCKKNSISSQISWQKEHKPSFPLTSVRETTHCIYHNNKYQLALRIRNLHHASLSVYPI
jgi:hypothetical protein